jgi:hypothetical protein
MSIHKAQTPHPPYYQDTRTYGIPASLHVEHSLRRPKQKTEALKERKFSIYVTLQTILSETPKPAEMRVMRQWANTYWATFWRNLRSPQLLNKQK